MKKTNKIIGGIVVTSLAASIIGGCYKFEAEKNVAPLYATPQSITEERIKEAEKAKEREEQEKQQEQEQQGQPKTETKK
mgnify:CR=1 FL=1